MPEIHRLEQSKRTRRERDPNRIAIIIATFAKRGLVHSSPTELSWHASERGIFGRGTLGRGSSGTGILGTLCAPAYSWSSYPSTSTFEVFPAASPSRRVGTARWGCYGARSAKFSWALRVWVSRVCGRGRGSRICGRGAGARGCGHGVCSRISWPCSGSTIGWSCTMLSSSSADVFTISLWPVVRGSLPSSSSSSSFSFSSSSSSSSSCSSCSLSSSPSSSSSS